MMTYFFTDRGDIFRNSLCVALLAILVSLFVKIYAILSFFSRGRGKKFIWE